MQALMLRYAYCVASLLQSQQKKTHRTQRDSYLAFCNITGSCPVPASVETVCRYAALLARSLKFSSVRQYLNIHVIRLLHLEAGEINPLDCYLVQSMLKGLRRQLGDRVIRKLPISPSLLLNILSSLNLDNVLHSAVWAAGLLMFFLHATQSQCFGFFS